jgi:hypothetical protein
MAAASQPNPTFAFQPLLHVSCLLSSHKTSMTTSAFLFVAGMLPFADGGVHSTVTVLARFRGWSTSLPSMSAMW